MTSTRGSRPGVRQVNGTSSADKIVGTSVAEDIYGLDGDDTLASNGGMDALFGGNGNDYLDAGQRRDASGKWVTATDNAYLDGGAGDDRAYGGAGNDTLHGGDGDDLLEGGSGRNMLLGGAGNDSYVINSMYDYVYDSGGVDSARRWRTSRASSMCILSRPPIPTRRTRSYWATTSRICPPARAKRSGAITAAR